MLHFGERVAEFERRGRGQPMYCRTCKQRIDGSQLDRNMNSRRRSSLRELRHNSLLLFRSSVFISAALYLSSGPVNLLAIFFGEDHGRTLLGSNGCTLRRMESGKEGNPRSCGWSGEMSSISVVPAKQASSLVESTRTIARIDWFNSRAACEIWKKKNTI